MSNLDEYLDKEEAELGIAKQTMALNLETDQGHPPLSSPLSLT